MAEKLISDDELFADAWEVFDEVGGPPTTTQYRELGSHDLGVIYDRFDGFPAFREAAGMDEPDFVHPNRIPRRKLLLDIKGLWWWLDRVPSTSDYKLDAKYSYRSIYRHFDSFIAAREEAGVGEGHLQHLTEEILHERLQTLYNDLGREPRQVDYQARFSNDISPFAEYGGFVQVKKDTGVYEGIHDNEGRFVTREEIVADIREKNSMVKGVITVTEYDVIGEYSARTVANRFGTFVNGRTEAGVYDGSLLERTGREHPNSTGHSKDIYKTQSWYRNRPKVLERDDFRCVQCGMHAREHVERFNRSLHVHHIVPSHFGVRDEKVVDESVNAPENLVTLCEDHHKPVWEGLFVGPREVEERFA